MKNLVAFLLVALAFAFEAATPARAQGASVISGDVFIAADSTTTNLGIDAVFTGTAFPVQGYSLIVVVVRASHASATNGLAIEQSTDNSNWDISDTATISAATTTELVAAVRAPYARVKYTNGGTAQTSFRLQTTKQALAAGPFPRTLSSSGNFKVELPSGSSATQVQGDVAHDAADSGNPVKIGGKATAAAPANVTEGDRVNQSYTLAGSARALDDNSAAIKTAAEIMDDWDETDRAKVNLIVGQAGVTAGAGAVAANTQRTTLASDDPAVTALQVIDDWDETDRAKVNPIAGQAGVAGGSGVVGATTQRVVLATDVALPAGTNAIGKLAANSGVDIGDVDVTSVVPGTGTTNLGKAEDQASADADVGVALMAVRKATPANTSGADGDYEALQISAGRLWASATIDAALPTGANTIGTVNVGTFPDNEPINVAQINGVAPSMGSGANGTGVQRVTIATDQGAITTQLPAALVGGRLDANAGAWLGSTAPTVGQKTMANSLPVALASDASTVAVKKLAPSQKTYAFTFNVVAAAGTAVEIIGPTSGSCEILEVYLTKPSAATTVTINKRSAASTLGTTGTAPTIVPHDATFAAATTTVKVFTADPTEGTLVGEIFRDAMGTGDRVAIATGDTIGAPITLNANTQVVTIELSAAATFVGRVVFTER